MPEVSFFESGTSLWLYSGRSGCCIEDTSIKRGVDCSSAKFLHHISYGFPAIQKQLWIINQKKKTKHFFLKYNMLLRKSGYIFEGGTLWKDAL